MTAQDQSTPRNWIEYWDKDDFWTGTTIWELNAAIFMRGIRNIVPLTRDDRVLTIGCGDGYLESFLAPNVAAVYALDTSPRFVEVCRETCAAHSNVTVEQLGEDYTRLDFLTETYTAIFCVNVVQYFRSLDEIVALVESGKGVAAPGAHMLMSDIPRKRGPIGAAWDIACSAILSARYGYLAGYLRTGLSRVFGPSMYRTFRSQSTELHFTNNDIDTVVRALPGETTVVRRHLSICANRPSLLVAF